MKKMLVLALAMMTTMSVNAQNGYDNTKHEVAVSYGYLTTSQVLDVFNMTLNIFTGYEPMKGSATGSISAEYFYNVNNWFGVGAIFSFGAFTMNYNMQIDNSPAYTTNNNCYTLLPAVKFNWLRREHFGMYSKLGAGVMLLDTKATPVDPNEKATRDQIIGFNFQASALGIEFGSAQFRGFIEGGFGEQGLAVAGLRYKF